MPVQQPMLVNVPPGAAAISGCSDDDGKWHRPLTPTMPVTVRRRVSVSVVSDSSCASTNCPETVVSCGMEMERMVDARPAVSSPMVMSRGKLTEISGAVKPAICTRPVTVCSEPNSIELSIEVERLPTNKSPRIVMRYGKSVDLIAVGAVVPGAIWSMPVISLQYLNRSISACVMTVTPVHTPTQTCALGSQLAELSPPV